MSRDRVLEGREEYKEILRLIPGTIEYGYQELMSDFRELQLESRQLKQRIAKNNNEANQFLPA